MKRNWKVSLIGAPLLCFLLWTGCAGLTQHKDEAAIRQVKKVALAGFAVVEPTTPNFSLSLKEKAVPEVDQMYLGLSKAFEKQGWKSVPLTTLRSNEGYKKAYVQTMEGFQNKYPVSDGHRRILVGEIMDNDSLRILGVEGRDALMTALGVDALVTAQIDVLLSGTTVMGIGSKYPFSRLSFWLFTRGKSTADWFEGGIDGETAKTSVGAAFVDVDLMNRLALESARTAYAKIKK